MRHWSSRLVTWYKCRVIIEKRSLNASPAAHILRSLGQRLTIWLCEQCKVPSPTNLPGWHPGKNWLCSSYAGQLVAGRVTTSESCLLQVFYFLNSLFLSHPKTSKRTGKNMLCSIMPKTRIHKGVISLQIMAMTSSKSCRPEIQVAGNTVVSCTSLITRRRSSKTVEPNSWKHGRPWPRLPTTNLQLYTGLWVSTKR